MLDIGDAPTVNPAGASPNDSEQISASPDAFGAGVGRAEQSLGGALEGAGTTALGVITEKAKLNNDLMVNDALTSGSQTMAGAAGDYMTNQMGKDAQSGLAAANASYDQIRQQRVSTMPSVEAQVALDNQLRRVQIHWTEASQNHADAQHKVWQQQSWTSGAANAADQAVTLRSDPEKTDEWLNTSDNMIRNLGHDKGMDDDTINRELQQNRGRNVAKLVEQTALQGVEGDGKPNVPLAKEYFEKYRGQMDVDSQLKVEGWIKAKTTQQTGDDAADAAMAKAHGDHGAPALTQQGRSVAQGVELPPVTADDGTPLPPARPSSFADAQSAPSNGSTPPVRGHGYANSDLPAFAQAAQPGGLSPAGMAKVVQIESGGNPNARNGSHVGLVQAGPSYWARFGNGSPLDPFASIEALGKSSASDAAFLRKNIGRQPTDAELYLAHQQGAGGAAKLLMYPNARAGDLVGDAAIRGNMGDPNATAAQFVARWSAKFGGASLATIQPGGGQAMTMPASVAGTGYRPFSATAPSFDASTTTPDAPVPQTFTPATDSAPSLQAPAAPASVPDTVDAPVTGRSAEVVPPDPQPSPGNTPVASVMAAAFDYINQQQDQGLLSPESAQVARTRIKQRVDAQQVAEEADSHGRKRANDAAADGYVSAVLKGNTNGLLDKIASDPNLTWETKRTLGEAIEKQTSDGSREAARHYGQGFFPALQAITAAPDDPNRISDPATLLSHVLPGGDLTLAGYEKLNQVFKENLRGPDPAAINGAKASLIAYAKSKLSFDQETSGIIGMTPLKDPRGAQIFNAQFIPRFEASYDQWIRAGKNPWEFLTQDNVDKLRKGMRDPSEMAAARISAGAGTEPSGSIFAPGATAPAPPPPPPIHGLDIEGWNAAVSQTPVVATPRGQISREGWAKALTLLATTPTPKNVRLFNESPFGRAGLSGSGLVKQITGLDVQAEQPPAAAPAGTDVAAPIATSGAVLDQKPAPPADWHPREGRILNSALVEDAPGASIANTATGHIVDAAGTLGEAQADADLEAGAKFSEIAQGVARGVGAGLEKLRGLVPKQTDKSVLEDIRKHKPKEDR